MPRVSSVACPLVSATRGRTFLRVRGGAPLEPLPVVPAQDAPTSPRNGQGLAFVPRARVQPLESERASRGLSAGLTVSGWGSAGSATILPSSNRFSATFLPHGSRFRHPLATIGVEIPLWQDCGNFAAEKRQKCGQIVADGSALTPCPRSESWAA
jgi:hypothetical protein